MAQAAKVLIRRVISLWVPAQNAERFLDSQRHVCCSKPTQTIPTVWVKHHAGVPAPCREGKQLLPNGLPHRDHFQVIRGPELQNTTPYKFFFYYFFTWEEDGKGSLSPHKVPSFPREAGTTNPNGLQQKGAEEAGPLGNYLSFIPFLPVLSKPHLPLSQPSLLG